MATLFVGEDVEALVVARLSAYFGDRIEFCSTELPKWVAPDRIPSLGIYLWKAGGYTRRVDRNALEYSQIMLHAFGRRSPEVAALAEEASAILLVADGDRLGTGRILSGPYSNPLPDHKYAHRVTSQIEIPVYNHIITI